jgi:tetratricopeptide (TPR) repeat protein
LKRPLYAALCLILFLALIEGGLQFRSWLDGKLLASRFHSGAKSKVLLIGDSVLGMEHEKNSIAEFLIEELQSIGSEKFEVINLSQPALTSGQLNASIEAYLSEHHPQWVVLLLGLSDLPLPAFLSNRSSAPIQRLSEQKSQEQVFEKIAHLKLVRFYYYLAQRIHEARQRLSFTSWNHSSIIPPHLSELAKSDPISVARRMKFYDPRSSDRTCFLLAMNAFAASKLDKESLPQDLDHARHCLDREADAKSPNANLYSLAAAHIILGDAYVNFKQFETASTYYRKAESIAPQLAWSSSAQAWLSYRRLRYDEAIPYFEKYLRLVSDDVVAIRGLNHSYREAGQFSRGHQFFKELAASSTLKALLEQLSGILATDDPKIASQITVPQVVTNEEWDLTDRDSYFTALWRFKKQNLIDKANATYLSVGTRLSVPRRLPLDMKSYQGIIEKALRAHSKILALSYPNEPDEHIEKALIPYGKSVSFFSLRSALSAEIPRQSILDLLDDDFVHVSPKGAQVLGRAIARRIAQSPLSSPLEEGHEP